jgi:large repetitive protein
MSKSAIRRMWVMVVMVLGMLALAAPAAWATEFSVNNTNDAPDANTTDGVCDSNSEVEGNQCTLRAAIREANAQGAADVINVPAGTYTLTIKGAGEDTSATGDLDIKEDLTINGAGAASTKVEGDAGFDDTIFENHSGASGTNTTLTGLTITGGSANDGGGIRNFATLTISDSTITGNSSSDTSVNSGGGGIYNDGTLTVFDSTISDNTASLDGGGITATSTEL